MQPHKIKAAVLNVVLETTKDVDVSNASGLDKFLKMTQSLPFSTYISARLNKGYY